MRALLLNAALLCVFIAPSVAASDQTGDVPMIIAGARTISIEEARTLLGKARIVDGRMRAAYLEGHLPGAVSSPHPMTGVHAHHGHGHAAATETSAHAKATPQGHSVQPEADKLDRPALAFGPNKDASIIIYGHGADCWLGAGTVRRAVEAGYQNVLWMRDGWDAWVANKLPVE